MGGGFQTCDTIAGTTWYMFAVTKAAGNSQLRSHLCDMATGVWTHTNRGVLNDSVGPIDHIWFGRAFGSYLGGNIAAAGAGPVNLSDVAVELLRPGLANWVDAAIAPIWRFNDTPVNDLTVTGANQTAIQGTTVNTALEPPTFDYDTSVEPTPEPEPEPEVQRDASFWGWVEVIRDSAAEYNLDKNRQRDTPIECPNDGEPLLVGPDGKLYCRYDGWRPLGAGVDN
jgi:hypothetical protein